MLERNCPFLHFFAVLSLAAACTADRSAAVDRLGTGGSIGVGGPGPDDGGSEAPVCAFGQIICDGTIAKVCNGRGAFSQQIPCDECKDGLGCVHCVPNAGVCSSGLATVCDSTGAHQVTFACDQPGMTCDPDGCHGPCSPTTLGMGNVGCDFWPTVTANPVWSGGFHFGVLLGNVSATKIAIVTITGPGKAQLSSQTCDSGSLCLDPLEVRAVALDWVGELKGADWQTPYQPVGPTTSVKSLNGAYHVTSNEPLVAYQFNPLEGSVPNGAPCPALPGNPTRCYSYSTDASLLLPAHTLSSSYVVSDYHAWHETAFPPPSGTGKLNMGDFVAITATQMDTVLTLNLAGNQSVLGWPRALPGEPGALTMNAGQVIELFTPGASADETLSGTEISSNNKSFQVLSGLGCASIPRDPTHCSHLEDPVLPTEILGKDYVVPSLYGASGDRFGHTIRVQSISDDTAVTFEPTMLTGVTLSRGEVVQIDNVMVDVRISSTTAFAVSQYVNGRSKAVPDGLTVGGPNQVTISPSSQFRTSYAFAASPAYEASFAAVIAPTGAAVMLDGVAIMSDSFMAVGASGMSVARVELTQNDRVHLLSADKPVGLLVYGFTPYASYAYAGGLDLKRAALPDRDK
jgi:IgGFc binding protein